MKLVCFSMFCILSHQDFDCHAFPISSLQPGIINSSIDIHKLWGGSYCGLSTFCGWAVCLFVLNEKWPMHNSYPTNNKTNIQILKYNCQTTHWVINIVWPCSGRDSASSCDLPAELPRAAARVLRPASSCCPSLILLWYSPHNPSYTIVWYTIYLILAQWQIHNTHSF